MVFEYNGTDYEFPDDMDDEQALRLIKQDLGEDTIQESKPQELMGPPAPEIEKGSYPWLKSEVIKHSKELSDKPGEILTPVVKMGGDIARSAGYTLGKVFEPLTKPITEKIGQAIPEPVKKFAGETAQSATETYRNIIPNEETRDIISSVFAIGTTALGLKAPSIAKSGSKALGESLEEFGRTTPNRILKPKERDFNAGFKPENVFKYDVDGTLDETIKKTQDKIESLSKELKTRIQMGDDAGARVDAFGLIDNTIEKMKGEGIKNLNKRQAINQLQALKEEISMSNPDGVLDLADAQDFKRAVGSEGAWYESKWGRMVDKDATAKEQAYSNLYSAIKNDIEAKAPEGIKEINQQLSELIPIENTALKRLYVAKRNEPISLKDMIGLATVASVGWKAAPVYLLNKTLNSPTTGKLAYRTGMALQGKKNLPSDIPKLKPKTENVQDALESPTFLRNKKELKSYPYLF